MKVGISTMLFYQEGLSRKNLLMIKNLGIAFIELNLYVGPDHDIYTNPNNQKRVEILFQDLNTYGIKIHSLHCSGGDISSLDNKIRTNTIIRIRREIDISAQLGGNVIVVHPSQKIKDSKEIPLKRFWIVATGY